MNSKSLAFRCLAVLVQLTMLAPTASAFPVGPIVLPPIPPIVVPPFGFPGVCEAAYDASTVSPKFTCAGSTEDGRAFAVWGTKNTAIAPTYVPVGASNRFIGGAEDSLGQPVSIEPGTHAAVVATFLPSSGSLSWKLGSSKASMGVAVCPTPAKTPGGLLVTLTTGEALVLEEDPDAIVSGTVVSATAPPPNNLPPPNNQGPVFAAGRTKGAFSVSDHGEATYDIPLWVPPGRAGMQPSLSLSYSSSGGNGPLGVGWAVSGLSQITRCAMTIAAQGEATEIHFDANDRMCLDGDYLIRVGDRIQTPFGSGPEYRPEHAPWTRVVMVGDDGARLGPSQIVVYDKSGMIHQYGTRADSRVEGWRKGFPGGDEYDQRPVGVNGKVGTKDWVRYAWLLADTQDRNGNAIRYTYTDPYPECMDPAGDCTTIERVPLFIDYNIKSGDPYPTRAVSFNYADRTLRTDASIKYVAGLAIRGVALLTSIEMRANAPRKGFLDLQRRYLLKYSKYLSPDDSVAFSTVTGRELLRSVQECDGTGACKQRSVFEWGNGDDDFDDIDTGIAVPAGGPKSVTPDPNHRQLVVGDFNGDGRDDIVVSQQVVDYTTRDPAKDEPPWPDCPAGCTGCFRPYPSEGCADKGYCCVVVPYPARPTYTTYPTTDLSALKWSLYTSEPDGTFKHASDNPSSGAAIWPNDKGLPAVQGVDTKGDGILEESVPVVATKYDPGYWSGDPKDGCSVLSCVDPEGAGRYVLDMDGDGRADLFRSFYKADLSGNYKWAFRKKDDIAYTVAPWFVRRDKKDQRTYALDLFGTGKAGLLLAVRPTRESQDPYWYSWAYLDAAGDVQKVPTSLPMGVPDRGIPDKDYLFTDFNGDGIADALSFENGSAPGAEAQMVFNTGAGFELTYDPPPVTVKMGAVHTIRVLNLRQNDSPTLLLTQNRETDGDMRFGRVEMVSYNPHDPIAMRVVDTGGHPIVWRKDGSHFIPDAYGQDREQKGAQRYVQTGDFNGDGLVDFTQLDTGTKTIHVRQSRGKRSDMMTHVKDGFDQHTWIDYTAIVGRTDSCTYPQHCASRGLWVVSAFHKDRGDRGAPPSFYGSPGVAGIDDYAVAYESPRWDLLGRGFLGFGRRTITGPAGRQWITDYNNLTSLSAVYEPGRYAHILYPYAGIPVIETVRVPSTGYTSVRTTTFEPRMPYPASGRGEAPYSMVPVLISEIEDQSGVRVRDVQTTIAYDGFDNPRLTQVRNRSGFIRRVSIPDYLNDTAGWILGRPQKIRTSSIEGTETVTRSVDNTYEPGTGHLVKTVREPSATDTTYLRTEYVRDANGLVIETRRFPISGGLGRLDTATYDAEGFPATTTNMLGHVTKTTYHSGLGVLARLIDPNGVTTTYRYDGFGRMVQKIAPDGADASVAYMRGEIGPYAELRAIKGAGMTRVEYDRAGRSWRNDRLAVDGRVSRTDTDFDPLFPGSAASRTLPYFTTDGVPGVTRFSYDGIGRLKRTIFPDATEITKTYDFVGSQVRTTTTDQVGRQSFVVEDELGRLVQSGHHGVVSTDSIAAHDVATTFTYHPFDLPSMVKDTKGNVVSTLFDVLGRRTWLGEPDTSLSGTHYNAFDEVDAEIDADGGTAFARDRLGRVTTSVSTTDGISCFTYDTAPHGVGKLAHSASAFSAENHILYDAISRPVVRQDTIGTRNFRVVTGYDGFGRPSNLKYPGIGGSPGLAVDYTYADGTNGELIALSEVGGGYFWRLEEADAAGRTTRDTLGNGVTTRRGYDPQRGWLSGITATKDATTIQNIQYAYWGDGNVRVRSEVSTLIAPPFAQYDYDALGRLVRTTLTDASVGSPVVTKYGYDDIGNLRTRTSPSSVVEEFKIEGPRPHATTSTDGRTYAYDAVGNQTTVKHGSTTERRIDYTSFGLPLKITQPTGVTTLQYDAANQRVRKTSADGSSTYYVGGLYELRLDSSGNATHVFFVNDVAQVMKKELIGGGIEKTILYRHADRLQSSYFATDVLGVVIEGSQQRFDPYGRREEWGMPGSPGSAPTAGINFGFTGHEEDDDVNLVNMRGRIYDPKLQRFLTPDPHVTARFDGRSYNRYAYAFGNPTNVTDPSGLDADSSGGDLGGAIAGALGAGAGFLAGCLAGNCLGGSSSGTGPCGPMKSLAPIVKAADTALRTLTADDNGVAAAQPKAAPVRPYMAFPGMPTMVYLGGSGSGLGWQIDPDETGNGPPLRQSYPQDDAHLSDYQKWLDQQGRDAPGNFLLAMGSAARGANNPGVVRTVNGIPTNSAAGQNWDLPEQWSDAVKKDAYGANGPGSTYGQDVYAIPRADGTVGKYGTSYDYTGRYGAGEYAQSFPGARPIEPLIRDINVRSAMDIQGRLILNRQWLNSGTYGGGKGLDPDMMGWNKNYR